MTQADRLALALETGVLALPAAGTVVVFRAEPARFLDLVPRERLRCVQTFRPLHDALAAARPRRRRQRRGAGGDGGGDADPQPRREPGRYRPRPRAILARAGRSSSMAPSTTGSRRSARQVAAVLPPDGAYVKAHGRLVWLTRPATLPDGRRRLGQRRRPAPQRRRLRDRARHVLARARRSRQPAPRRGAPRPPRRPRRRPRCRLGLARPGGARPLRPEIAELDLYEAEALALDAARTNVADPRARFHWADVARLGAGARATTRSSPTRRSTRPAPPSPTSAPPSSPPPPASSKPDGRLLLVANRQLPYEAPLAAAFRHVEKLSEDAAYKVVLAEATGAPRPPTADRPDCPCAPAALSSGQPRAPMTDPVDLTAALIRCPSVTPAEGGAIELVAQVLAAAGFRTERVDRNGIANLFARWGTAGPVLGFNGHTDVVPPGDPRGLAARPLRRASSRTASSGAAAPPT